MERGFWLNAHYDPVANLRTFSTCLHTCDLYGDGDWRLAVAGLDKKLKVWKGTQLASEHALLDIPCAITSFYADAQSPRIPALAVAVGPNVFIYRNLRPYFKFTLPLDVVSEVEKTIWQQVYTGSLTVAQARSSLLKLSRNGPGSVAPSTVARELEGLDEASQEAEIEELSHQFKGEPPLQQSVITCMTTIKKAYDEEDAVSCLVIGTESSQVLVLTPTANQATHIWQLNHVPAFICVSGLLDVEHRLAIASRHGKVILMKNGAVTATIPLDALPLGIARSHRGFVIGCTNSTVQCYSFKGRRTFCINLPSPILAMHGLETPQQRIAKCLVVSLANGEVRVYNDQHLVSITPLESPVNALTFGKFGREENTLIGVTRTGGLDIKMLPRAAKLEGSRATGPPPEQDIPLDIPKRTAVYVEQTEREKANAVDMHTTFQQELVKLRLATAKAYLQVLTDGQGATSASPGALSLNATVTGLGPAFKLTLELCNSGSESILDAALVLRYDQQIYTAQLDQMLLPVLLPSLKYCFDFRIRCVDPTAGVGNIKVLLHSSKSPIPLLVAVVKMPLSEMEEE
ncbi:Bardet-Biedl syndrome 1 protein, variant 2 [Trebouxia sp. C0010 RCD-2024]